MSIFNKIKYHFKSDGLVFFIYKIRSRVVNKIFNSFYKYVYKKNISFYWSDIKIINYCCMKIGDNFQAGRSCWLEAVNNSSELIIGDNVVIADWVHIAALNKVTISSGCLMGSKVFITDHFHGKTTDISIHSLPPNDRQPYSKGPVFIDENVWIGDGVAILPNVKIGRGSIIGSNSVVTKDIPPYSIAVGIPAKVIQSSN
ncbi:exopolysaccharide biosynthesis protein [Xenorhabdus stockiae]|uniref:Exopolysaccharide biosynthesis protein n=1 Tax=Xenorhabdus stockiae TaxID=351614 RepID=A0A2D0KS71_9GAMM|nr:acyltransferase [Xenorhabdus stockiae]PHM66218.1 exopolysaccharide biosynthesis protein [Xenorhabdus stockiae]